MTTLREAAQQALEALHEIAWSNDSRWQTDRAESVIPALRDALAQQAQEPVAWRHWLLVDGERFPQLTLVPRTDIDEPLYTRPPRRREWQGLTEEEIVRFADAVDGEEHSVVDFARAIEAALKEKNT